MAQRTIKFLLGEADDLLRLKRSQWAPCEEKLYKSLEIIEYLYEQDGDEDKFWGHLSQLCKQSYWAFLRVALGYRWMDPYWHGEEITTFIENTIGQDRVIILPRGSGKTAMISTTYPVWAICKNPFSLCQITNAAEEKAAIFTKTVANILIKSPRIKRMYPLIKKDPNQWGMAGYKLDTEAIMRHLRETGGGEGVIERTDPTLRSYGMRGNITGAHVTLQVHDDLISSEVSKSPTLLTKAEDFLREGIRCCDAQGEVLVAGTRWLYHDFYGKIINGELVGSKGQFEVLKRGILKPDGSLVWPQRTFIDMSGAITVAGYTEEQLEGFKKDPNYDALYLSDPKSENSSPLDITMVHIEDHIPFITGKMDRVIFETNSGGEIIANTFSEQCRREGRYEIRVGKIHTKVTKTVRIDTLLGAEINGGKFHVLKDLWSGRDGLYEELREYPKGRHDDLLDCCAYLAKACVEPRPGEPPRPVIVIDPAWTTTQSSDPTALVCGVRVNGDLWILAARRIRTSRPEVLAQEIFRMYYMWNNVEQKATIKPKKVYNGVRSFNSLVRGRSTSRGIRNGGFTVDLEFFNKRK